MFHIHHTLWEQVQYSVYLSVLFKLNRATKNAQRMDIFAELHCLNSDFMSQTGSNQRTGRVCLGPFIMKHVFLMGSSCHMGQHARAIVCRLVLAAAWALWLFLERLYNWNWWTISRIIEYVGLWGISALLGYHLWQICVQMKSSRAWAHCVPRHDGVSAGRQVAAQSARLTVAPPGLLVNMEYFHGANCQIHLQRRKKGAL